MRGALGIESRAHGSRASTFTRVISFYDLLGVSQDATEGEIRRAYRVQARIAHPDLHHDSAESVLKASQASFRLVQEAYETLTDPTRRAAYDGRPQGESGRTSSPSLEHLVGVLENLVERFPSPQATEALAKAFLAHMDNAAAPNHPLINRYNRPDAERHDVGRALYEHVAHEAAVFLVLVGTSESRTFVADVLFALLTDLGVKWDLDLATMTTPEAAVAEATKVARCARTLERAMHAAYEDLNGDPLDRADVMDVLAVVFFSYHRAVQAAADSDCLPAFLIARAMYDTPETFTDAEAAAAFVTGLEFAYAELPRKHDDALALLEHSARAAHTRAGGGTIADLTHEGRLCLFRSLAGHGERTATRASTGRRADALAHAGPGQPPIARREGWWGPLVAVLLASIAVGFGMSSDRDQIPVQASLEQAARSVERATTSDRQLEGDLAAGDKLVQSLEAAGIRWSVSPVKPVVALSTGGWCLEHALGTDPGSEMATPGRVTAAGTCTEGLGP